MAYVVRKTFDWEEDRQNYKFPAFCRVDKGTVNTYLLHRKLSWKGWLRRLFRMKKPKGGK